MAIRREFSDECKHEALRLATRGGVPFAMCHYCGAHLCLRRMYREMRSNLFAGPAILVLLAAGAAFAQLPPVPPPSMPRGLVSHSPEVTSGYVLFAPIASNTVYMIGNDGTVFHTWKNALGGVSHYLEADGTLLRGFRDPKILHFRQGGVSGGLQEIDWEGNVLWEWRLGDEKQVLHHDIERLPNGNILVLGWEVKTREEAIAAGRRPDAVEEKGLMNEFVLEIQPIRPNGAKIVWRWDVWDHLVQDHDANLANYGDPAAHPERLDLNSDAGVAEISSDELEQLKALGYVDAEAEPADLRVDFLHINAIDYRPGIDQFAVSVPSLGEVWILDHSTTPEEARESSGGRAGKGGDILYRWGNPATYRRGDASSARFFFQHDVRWVPEGWDRAGNLTIFNNGRARPAGPFSSVDEIKPPLNADGAYDITAGQAYGPPELAWTARLPPDRFAPFISGSARLKNGNTFVCSGTDGKLLELSPAGEIVWEYRNPYSGDLMMADGKPATPGTEALPYAVFRGTRIPADHPALVGRELKPLAPQPPWADPPDTPDGAAEH